MANDPNPQLRAELLAALDALAPQIRGLRDLAAVSISPALSNQIKEGAVARERRRDLIQIVINNLNTTYWALSDLESDGYPNLPTTTLDAAGLEELQGEKSDLQAAFSVFQSDSQPAVSMTVGLGEPADKPPANP